MTDGKLHKGFFYGDYSSPFENKKRDNDFNKHAKPANKNLNYFGLPFQIYSAKSDYTLKQQIRNYIIFFLYPNILHDNKNNNIYFIVYTTDGK